MSGPPEFEFLGVITVNTYTILVLLLFCQS